MSDLEDTAAQAAAPLVEYPERVFPVVYADGIASLSRGYNVKFYLYRIDPNMLGQGGANARTFAQVVMPRSGFASSVAFLMRQVGLMVSEGSLEGHNWEGFEKEFEALKSLK